MTYLTRIYATKQWQGRGILAVEARWHRHLQATSAATNRWIARRNRNLDQLAIEIDGWEGYNLKSTHYVLTGRH